MSNEEILAFLNLSDYIDDRCVIQIRHSLLDPHLKIQISPLAPIIRSDLLAQSFES
jgi:hypothetical protein